MQGMGIQFRPELSTAVVSTQELGKLTAAGYGAGSYWKSVWAEPTPVVSTLGNTTRSYERIRGTADGLRQALAPRFRGFYNKDLMSGMLPEADDCGEALATCLALADVYRPPVGSGLDEQEADIDF